MYNLCLYGVCRRFGAILANFNFTAFFSIYIWREITEESVEETVTVLVVENITVRAESPSNPLSPFSSFRLIYKMERECAWSLEMASKLAEVILNKEL